jgi:hypothetical protein
MPANATAGSADAFAVRLIRILRMAAQKSKKVSRLALPKRVPPLKTIG